MNLPDLIAAALPAFGIGLTIAAVGDALIAGFVLYFTLRATRKQRAILDE